MIEQGYMFSVPTTPHHMGVHHLQDAALYKYAHALQDLHMLACPA